MQQKHPYIPLYTSTQSIYHCHNLYYFLHLRQLKQTQFFHFNPRRGVRKSTISEPIFENPQLQAHHSRSQNSRKNRVSTSTLNTYMNHYSINMKYKSRGGGFPLPCTTQLNSCRLCWHGAPTLSLG